jgi:hypothetical protein
MTNENPVTDNQVTFTPQKYNPGALNIDLFAPHQSFYQSPDNPRYHYRVQSTGERSKYKGELIIYDFRGGTGLEYGDFNRDFDRFQFESDGLDTRFSRMLLLPLKITSATSPDPSGTSVGMSHERIFGRLMIGVAAGNGASLFRETSTTDPTIEATAYNAGSAITALDGIVSGGATAARQLLISRAGGVAQLISDVDGTVATSGHADLNPCWGACQTFLNSDTILFYADNGIYALDKTQAISTAPTLTMSNLPDGGYWLDNEPFRVGNSPYRCYLALPKQDTSGGMVPLGTTGDFEIVSINQEGFDPVPVNFPQLPKITYAVRFRTGIVATDNYDISYYDGQQYIHTSPFAQKDIGGGAAPNLITGLWVIGEDLYARIQFSTTVYFTMMWDVDTNAWHFVSTDITSGSPEYPRSRGLPWSFNSGITYRYMHVYENGSWRRQQWTTLEQNPYFLQEGGNDSGVSFEFHTDGNIRSTAWDLPGLEGKPKAITAITFMGNLYDGDAVNNTTVAEVGVTVGGRSATFKKPASNQWKDISQRVEFAPTEVFDKLRLDLDITQGSGGTNPDNYTPNALPIKIEFIAWEYPTPGIGQMPSLPLHD